MNEKDEEQFDAIIETYMELGPDRSDADVLDWITQTGKTILDFSKAHDIKGVGWLEALTFCTGIMVETLGGKRKSTEEGITALFAEVEMLQRIIKSIGHGNV